MEVFGKLQDGTEVHRITLATDALSVAVLTHGATLQDVRLPGLDHSLTLGTGSLEPYEGKMASFGGLVGPVVNRISGAQATLDGKTYAFDANDGANTLHSGSAATHRKVWNVIENTPARATLSLQMPDGEGGFPGNRLTLVRYALEGSALTMTVRSETDAPGWINFANHSYWNLDGTGSIDGHRLTVAADRYLPDDGTGLPTGEVLDVAGTDFDFREGRRLRPSEDPTYDNNLCLAGARRELTNVALLEGTGGTLMSLATTEPGLQVYDGYKLTDLGVPDHQGRPFAAHRGMALEAQGWPDAMTHDGWPGVRIDPGTPFEQITRWTFSRG